MKNEELGMKVAYLIGSLNRGGAETLLLDVFRNVGKASYKMIGIHRKGGAYQDDFYAAGPKMIHCAPKRFGFMRYLWRLRKILLRENVTIVHAQQSIDCVYARMATIRTGIRVVETFHGYDFVANRYLKFIHSLSIRWADAVCFVSKSQRDYYVKEYRIKHVEKLHVVYNGIDFSKFDKVYPAPDFLANKSNRVRLAMVGNFVHVRSQNVIVNALHKLTEESGMRNVESVKWDFYFVGRRHEKEPWRYDDCVRYCAEHGLTDCVHFVGGRGDVPAILQHIDGFVYSTAHDTFGIAVVEALANGLPVVVNDWEVMKEITHNGEWATLFRTGDVADCAEAMRKLIENIEEAKQRAQEIAPKIREAYSIEAHIRRLSEVYKS